jgi:hypothetical protein
MIAGSEDDTESADPNGLSPSESAVAGSNGSFSGYSIRQPYPGVNFAVTLKRPATLEVIECFPASSL